MRRRYEIGDRQWQRLEPLAVADYYDKDSPDPQRPHFHRRPLQMIGWLMALVDNAVGDLVAGTFFRRSRGDLAVDVLRASQAVVLHAVSIDRLSGPALRKRVADPVDRQRECPRASPPLVGEPPPGDLTDIRSAAGGTGTREDNEW
jgi:hypothetical protein